MQPRELEHRAANSRSGLSVQHVRALIYRNETDREDARNEPRRPRPREKETHPPLDREPPGLCNAQIPPTRGGVTRRIPSGLRTRPPDFLSPLSLSPSSSPSSLSPLLFPLPFLSSLFDRGYQEPLIDTPIEDKTILSSFRCSSILDGASSMRRFVYRILRTEFPSVFFFRSRSID